MVIFHSYVKLPEGTFYNHRCCERCDPISATQPVCGRGGDAPGEAAQALLRLPLKQYPNVIQRPYVQYLLI
jgi:hypothetical protein